MPLELRYVVADVFTDTPLTGNQLAVFTDGRGADDLLAVLGVESELPVDWYDLGPSHVYVALRTPEEVAALRPDFQALRDFESGINCFAPLDGGARWKTRMFAPADGVAEDPAT